MHLLLIAVIISLLGCGAEDFHLGSGFSRKFGSEPFSASRWKADGLEARGNMITSLMKSHRRELQTEAGVISLLGPSECRGYHVHDLCYRLMSKGTRYHLEFTIDRATNPGRVLGSMLGESHPESTTLTVRSVPGPGNSR